jgi:hypothetical protein
MLRKKRIIFLSTFGHCGIDWMHSLLDSHGQILIPPALSFFRCWKMLKAESAQTPDEMFNIWFSYITKYISYNSKNEQKKFLHSQYEEELFFSKLSDELNACNMNVVDVFWSIYESYIYSKKIHIDSIKVIVIHEHLPWSLDYIYSEFGNALFLLMMRDPRAAIAGIMKGRVDDFGYLPDFTFNTIFETWMQANDFTKKHGKELNNRLKIVRNEDLHTSLGENMRHIALWMGINFEQNMLIPTNFSGIIKTPDSRYLSDDIKITPDFYSSNNIEKRWLSVLSIKNIWVIESLFREIMIDFNYKPKKKYTRLLHIKSIGFFLIPNKILFSKWLKDYPNIDDFSRIGLRLKELNGVVYHFWRILPASIKFFLLNTVSISRRIRILFFPGKRWDRYDNDIKNY